MRFVILHNYRLQNQAKSRSGDFGGAGNCYLAAHGHDVTILETYEKGYLKPQFDSRVRFDAICSKSYTEKYYASLKDIRSEKNWGRKLQKCGKQIFSKLVGYRPFAEKLAAKRYEICDMENNHCHQICNVCGKITEIKSQIVIDAVGAIKLQRFRRERLRPHLLRCRRSHQRLQRAPRRRACPR